LLRASKLADVYGSASHGLLIPGDWCGDMSWFTRKARTLACLYLCTHTTQSKHLFILYMHTVFLAGISSCGVKSVWTLKSLGWKFRGNKCPYPLRPVSVVSGDFISLFPTHPDFRNSTEVFHLHETLSTPMKLLSSLFINMVPQQHNKYPWNSDETH
jgi:hypothetical protein